MTGKPRRLTRWILEALLIVSIVLAVQAWHKRDAVSGRLPTLSAVLADGGEITSGSWRAGHPGRATALYFWAEWCPICRLMEGNVDSLDKGWPVLTVAMQSGNARQVARHLAERGLAWPTAIDADGAISRRFGLHGVPAFVVVDPHGEIRFVEIGYTSGIGLRLRLWWAEHIGW